MKSIRILFLFFFISVFAFNGEVKAQQEGMMGEVKLFAGTFAPRGWAFCEGQLLSINQNSALFSILGTTFGGDGRTTFGLPDLRGRSPIGPGNGPGLSNTRLGARGGSENSTLTISQLPSHNHIVTNVAVPAFEMHPEETEHKYIEGAQSFIAVGNNPSTTDGSGTIKTTQSGSTMDQGGSQSFNIRDPYLGMHYIICLVGTFPSRN